jgi:hypothetical protein
VARATFEDVAFRWLATDQHPTYSTLSRFRERNLANFRTLFLRVLKLCQEADLIGGTRMALDGTKVKASASKHKAMSHGKMLEKEKQLDEELRKSIEEYFRKVAENDAEEDKKFGKGNNPYLGDPTIKSKKDRLEKIRRAEEAIAERERQKANAAGREVAPIDPKTQYNFTDPESWIMPDVANRGSFVQAYNCQAMVDEKAQIIVAAEATQAPQDQRQLVPMTELTMRNLGSLPGEILSDASYFSEAAIREVEGRGVDVYCPPERVGSGPLRSPEVHRGAGVRSDQTGERPEAVPVEGASEGPREVGPMVPDPQHYETAPSGGNVGRKEAAGSTVLGR